MQFHHHRVKREGLLGDICPFLNFTENLHTSLKSYSSLGILDSSVVKIVMSTGECALWGFTSTAEQRDVFFQYSIHPFLSKRLHKLLHLFASCVICTVLLVPPNSLNWSTTVSCSVYPLPSWISPLWIPFITLSALFLLSESPRLLLFHWKATSPSIWPIQKLKHIQLWFYWAFMLKCKHIYIYKDGILTV